MALDRAWEILVRTCWLGQAVAGVSDDELAATLRLARRNDVEAGVVRAYAARLPVELAALEKAVAGYRENLGESCRRLAEAGVRAILIKATPDEDFTYSNFDLVVGDDGWGRAVEALRSWVVRTSQYPLERGTKLLLYPATGPAVHLHREVAWFDIPAIPTAGLRAEAVAARGVDCLLPSQVDALRILVAHAAFQNLALSLGDLLAFRRLADEGTLADAMRSAELEGWGRGFRSAARTASQAMRRLDRLEATRLPAPLSLSDTLVGGVGHALHLAGTRRFAAAARELALRGPLVAAKRRAAYR